MFPGTGIAVVLLLISTPSLTNADVFTAQQVTELTSFVDTLMQCRGTVGLAMAVVKGNETWTRGFGFADREEGRRVTTSDLFGKASLTKAFTSALISLFLNQTNHSWNTPIVDILGKDFELATEELTRQVTLKDVLSHRTGLDNIDIPLFAASHLTRQEYARRIRYLPVKKSFRDEYDYNNWMYGLAGCVAERMGGGGVSWEKLLHAHLLQPLNMSRSGVLGVTVPLEDARLATPYVRVKNRVVRSDRSVYSISPVEAAGAVASPADDMTKWMQLLLTRGRTPDGRQLLSEGHLREMTSPHVSIPQAKRAKWNLVPPEFPALYATDGYGLGWFTANYRGYPMVWHTGNLFAYTSYLGLIPSTDLAVFVSTNGPQGKNASHLIRQLFFRTADLLLGKAPWLNVSNACHFPGLWRPAAAAAGGNSSASADSIPPPASCEDFDFNSTKRYIGSYRHRLFEDVDITGQGERGLYVRYNLLEGRLCRTSLENVAYFQVVGSMAFSFHPGERPVYLQLRFVRLGGADGRFSEVRLSRLGAPQNVLVFRRDGETSSASKGDRGKGFWVVVLVWGMVVFCF